jgi:hypothetical protein
MVPPAPRECNQPARSALHRKQFAAHRPAQRIGLRIPCITAHRANATSPRAAHHIANNPRTVQRAARTDNQPAAHRPQRTAHTAHLQLCTRFAVLCANEFRPYYTVQNNYMIWHDYAVIKLNYLFESLNKIGLVKRLDAQLRLWVNTGTVRVAVGAPTTSADTSYLLSPADNTFSNTCPLLVNYLPGLLPTGTNSIVAGLYIGKAPTTSFAGINLGAANISHPLTNCRLYYSQVTVDPQKSIDYVQRNRNKKVIYRSFVTNSWTNTAVGSSFNALVNSGIVHPTGILICPFIAANTTSGLTDFQWKSPFDTCPATMSPLSLTNLQVSIGGQNVLNSTLNMTYENFLEQINLAEQLTSSDFGVSTGLISQQYWEQSKWYFVNVERGNIADKLQPRNSVKGCLLPT